MTVARSIDYEIRDPLSIYTVINEPGMLDRNKTRIMPVSYKNSLMDSVNSHENPDYREH